MLQKKIKICIYCISKLKSNTLGFLNAFQNTIMGIDAVAETN